LEERRVTDLAASESVDDLGWGFRIREKPRLWHLFAGVVASGISYVLLWFGSTDLMTRGLVGVLSVARISVSGAFGQQTPTLAVDLVDGSVLNLVMTQQRVGLVTVAIFGLLFLLLLFPLQGSLWRKLTLLELGFAIGLTWNFIRLSLTVLAGYNFGINAFRVAEFFTTPFLDFLWVITLWSLGLSTMVSRNRAELKK
jgi:exosortase/archaeosortase family protein